MTIIFYQRQGQTPGLNPYSKAGNFIYSDLLQCPEKTEHNWRTDLCEERIRTGLTFEDVFTLACCNQGERIACVH